MSRARVPALPALLLLLPTFALLGCGGGPTAAEVESPVAGDWRYDGVQTAPEPHAIRGTLRWFSVRESPRAFEGSHRLFEELPNGAVRPLAGSTSGELLADTIADFDLEIAGVRRRHVGALRGDSIVGDWIQLSGSSASGRFVLRRESVPAVR
jgi:hypothetical protein